MATRHQITEHVGDTSWETQSVNVSEPPGPSVQGTRPGVMRQTRGEWALLTILWGICGVYLFLCLRRAWIPHDAGMLAEMAERVLRGQIPHRDFIEVYTGGLTYLNALAFHIFGTNLFSLRIPLFLFFLGWVPSLYFIARRFCRPWLAATFTLLAVAWSVPNYPEAMPSWYNLFFATWGVLALLRYIKTEHRRWLWLAGMCAGLSFLVKITALYFVAACLMFFVYRETVTTAASADNVGGDRTKLVYKLFVTAGLAAFLCMLIALVATRPTANDFLQFVLPTGCLVIVVGWSTWVSPVCSSARRFGRLLRMALPFAGGVAIPIVPFLAYYAHEAALALWFKGVFLRTAIRTSWAAHNPASLAALLVVVPIFFVAASDSPSGSAARWRYLAGSTVIWTALLLAAWRWYGFYLAFGASIPLFVLCAGVLTPFCLRPSAGLAKLRAQEVFLVVAAGVTAGLIQFPYAMAAYSSYVAPLLALALLALWSTASGKSTLSLGPVLGFYLVFALWLHAPAYISAVGGLPGKPPRLQPIALDRAGGMRAPVGAAREYQEVISTVRKHASGRFIYCTPDCPQIYFLSGVRNPTGTIYDFLDPDFLDPVVRVQRILGVLELHGVSVVVLGSPDDSDSGRIPPVLRASLDARYPDSTTVGEFQVRWRPQERGGSK